MKAGRIFTFFSLFCFFLPLSAQSPDPSVPDELLDIALAVNLNARVETDTSAVPAWHNVSTAVTLPGKPVSLKIEALNIRLLISLTPYRTKDGTIILVVQNQVWATDENKSVMYQSTINTVQVSKGQKLTMYPLGRPKDGKGTMIFDIFVLPYRESAEFSGLVVGGESGK